MKTKLFLVLLFIATAARAQTPFVTTWKTDNPGGSNSTSITIPTFPGETYNYEVDWNYDGNTFNIMDTGVTGDITHDYGTGNEGTYTVAIRGTFPRIYFPGFDNDKEKILSVDQWGSIAWTSMADAFISCSNLNVNGIDNPDLSNLTDMSYVFTSISAISQDITSWDVSNVTNMAGMFGAIPSFNQDISGWVTSNVTNMADMFLFCQSFDQDISGWDVSSVQDMSNMFAFAVNFNQDLSLWDVSNVNNMSQMFRVATSFNGLINWSTSNVTNMSGMFNGAASFNQDISGWDTSSVTNMSEMFVSATSFNQDIGGWNTSNVIDMSFMFNNATSFDQNLGNWDLSSITTMSNMFSTNAKLSTTNYDNTLIGWAILDAGETQIPMGINFNGGASTYCNGEIARNDLSTTYGWTIADGGLDCSTLSIENFENTPVSLFPNPTRHKVYISTDLQLTKIEVYDLLGKRVLDQHAQFESIDVSGLTSGVYLMKLIADGTSNTFRIVRN